MQSKEFDNLFVGQDAKWADFKQVKNLATLLSDKPTKGVLRQAIQKVEEPIPAPTRKDIDALISKLRADGCKETKIRRIVKNTFRITVI